MFDDKVILVTGGTGSFGRAFIKHLLANFSPKKIIVFSRDELKQFEMLNDLQPNFGLTKLNFFIGDVRDRDRLLYAMEGVDICIHAAALKQVPAAEYNPFEAIKTNILGAQNVIEACIKNNVSQCLALSTDKAAAPINLYGATKLASDKLFTAAANYVGAREMMFSVVRYGNVMGSRGSVIPFFRSRSETKTLPITHPEMTRFNLTLEEGVKFVVASLARAYGGEIFVPKIPSYKILDVAEAVCPSCSLEFVGMRPGEKLHEEMITESDGRNTIEFQDYFIICPSWTNDHEKFLTDKLSKEKGKKCLEGFSYNSRDNNNFLTVAQIRELLGSV